MSKAVVLAHGLFMKKEIMFYLKSAFEQRGYKVYNYNYSTLSFSEKTLDDFADFVSKVKEDNVYFLGHSMGGLLMKAFIERDKPVFKDMCLVTLGTPHKGSSFGKMVEKSKFGFVLGTSPKSGITDGILKWSNHCELGCIVGTMNFGVNTLFKKEKYSSDGTVTVEEAIDDNATDVIKLPLNHTGMVYSRKAVEQAVCFFKTKRFFP